MKKLLVALGLLGLASSARATVTVIDVLGPKNNAFQYVVNSTNVFVDTTTFSKNLTSLDANLQHAMDTIDQISAGSGISVLAVTTGNAGGFSSVISSPTYVLNVDSTIFTGQLAGGGTFYLSVIPGLYLTSSSAAATYQMIGSYLTTSSATATYIQLSSVSATYLTQSSAALTYQPVGSYLTTSSASATYLQLSSASATYQPIGSYIKLTSTLQSGATFYVSSGTVNGPLYVNNLTDSALTNGQCVQAGANGLLTVTGTSCGSGAGTITSVVAGTDLTGGGNSGSVTLNLSTPSVVLNTETLQSGTSFYVASGTVAGNLTISTINVNNSVELAGSYGLPGQILTSEGSAPPSWQSTIGSGVSFATGTILQTPSAPLGGTWLACDGSAQSTSTYPALYAAIGQTYMNFTSTFPTSTNSVSAASIPIWLGTTTANWLVDSANGTAVWWGSTGTWLTQTSVGSGLSALTANLAVGYALSYTNTTSAALTTSLSNISFAGNTLPTAPGSFQKVIAPGNASTAVFLYCVTGSQTVYTMTKGGTIWASTAGALPKTGTPGAIWWDGTDWNILMTNGVLEQTSLVSGTANWTVAYSSTSILAMYAPIANNQQNAEVGSFDNAPNVVLAPFSAGNSIVSTNSLVTSQQYPQSFVTYQSPTSVFWNGYVYVAIVAFNGSTAVNNVVPQYIESTIYTSKDGKQWINDTTGIFMCPAAQFTGTMTNTLSANTTTGAFLMLGENPGGPSPGGTSLMIVTPTVNPQSQFNLPLKPGYYIRAL